jgi:hypothetical protein
MYWPIRTPPGDNALLSPKTGIFVVCNAAQITYFLNFVTYNFSKPTLEQVHTADNQITKDDN